MFNTILAKVGEHVQTLKDYPPAQEGSSLALDQMIDRMLNSRPSQD
jgi:hypothetical protein